MSQGSFTRRASWEGSRRGQLFDRQSPRGRGGFGSEFGFAPALEARFGKKDLESEQLSVSYQRVAPNEMSPFAHRHKQQTEEIYVVVEGGGCVHLDDKVRDLKAWDAVRVAGPVIRSFEAGADGLTILAFGEINPTNDAKLIQPEESES